MTGKTLCYYHSGDWDGICSAVVVKRAIPDAELIPINYGEDYNEKVFSVVTKNDVVVVVDFNLKPIKKMVKLDRQCKSLIWIDHHIDMITDSETIQFQPLGLRIDGTAACVLAWKYFFGDEPVPVGIDLIGKFDVHQYEDSRVIPFQFGLKFNELSPYIPVWEKILNNEEKVVDTLISEGIILEKYEKKEHVKRAKECGFEVDFGDYKAFAVNGYVNIDNLGDSFNSEKYHFLLTFVRLSGWWRYRLSTRRPDVNVGEICRRFGGGGHKSIAGFEMKDDSLAYKIIRNKVVITK